MPVFLSRPVRQPAVKRYSVQKRPSTMQKEATEIGKPTPDTSVNEPEKAEVVQQPEVVARIEVLDKIARESEVIASRNDPDDPLSTVDMERIRAEGESARNKADLLQSYVDAGEKVTDDVKAITSEKLSPFVKLDRNGNAEIDTVTAVKAGVSTDELKGVGVEDTDIEEARQYIKDEKQYRKDSYEYRQTMEKGGKVNEDGSVTVTTKGKRSSGSEMKQYIVNKKVTPLSDNRDYLKDKTTWGKLTFSNDGDGVYYDIQKYLKDNPGFKGESNLISYGFAPEDVLSASQAINPTTAARLRAAVNKAPDLDNPRGDSDDSNYMSLYEYQQKEFLKTQGQALDIGADMLVPFYWVKRSKDMKPWEIALNTGIDALFLVPVIGQVAKAAKTLSPATRAIAKLGAVAAKNEKAAQVARNILKTTRMGAPEYAEAAALSQKLDRVAIVSRQRFVEKIAQRSTAVKRLQGFRFVGDTKIVDPLKKLNAKQLRFIEKKGKLPGFADAVTEVRKAEKALNKAGKKATGVFKEADLPEPDTLYRMQVNTNKAFQLAKAEKRYADALARMNQLLTPRYNSMRNTLQPFTSRLRAVDNSDAITRKLAMYDALKAMAGDNYNWATDWTKPFGQRRVKPGAKDFALDVWVRGEPPKTVKEGPASIKDTYDIKKMGFDEPQGEKFKGGTSSASASESAGDVKGKGGDIVESPEDAAKDKAKLLEKMGVKQTKPSAGGTGTAGRDTQRELSTTMTAEQAAAQSGVQPIAPYLPVRIPKRINLPKRDVQVIRTTIQKAVTEMTPTIKGATSAGISPAEMIDIGAVIKSAQKARTDAERENLTASQTDTEVKAAVQSEVKTQLKTRTQTTTTTTTATTLKTETPPRIPERPGKKTRIRPPIPELEPKKKDDDKSPRLYPEGTIAWKQGIGWWVWSPPWDEDKDADFTIEKPEGITVYPDAKSAFDTIQSKGGNVPSVLTFDRLGIVKARIESPPRSPVRGSRSIKFTRKPEIQSKRVGKMVYTNMGRGGVLSTRTVRTIRRS